MRTVERAQELVQQGARKVIVGTAAFAVVAHGVNVPFLRIPLQRHRPRAGNHRPGFQSRAHRNQGLAGIHDLTAESVLEALAPYCSGFLCTYVDKEGMLSGTDLEWFRRLRAATPLEITAAGGITTLNDVRALMAIDVHAALGMAIYTGRLRLEELAGLLQR